MDVIYADELFFLNALIDWLLLRLAALFTGRAPRRGGAALAGVLGGLYAVAAALPPGSWLRGWGAELAVSAVLVLSCFGSRGFGRVWGTFLCLAAGLAGAAYALSLLPGGGGAALLPALGLCYAAVRLFPGRGERERRIVTAEVRLGERTASFPALRDTGHSLTDPIGGRGVLIADREALAPLFEAPLPAGTSDAAALFRVLSERRELRGRLRLTPYAALGNSGGLLVCFRPDAVTLAGEGRQLLVALSPTPFAGEDFRAVY